MPRSRLCICLLINALALVSRLLGAEDGVDVCTAAKGGSSKKSSVVVRGRGQALDEGLALASELCPVAKTGYDEVPTVILVHVVSFATPEAKGRFLRAEAEKGLSSPLLDIEVSGTIECRARMRFIKSGKDVVGANGFGGFGLYKCSMNSAELLEIRDSRVQPKGGSRR